MSLTLSLILLFINIDWCTEPMVLAWHWFDTQVLRRGFVLGVGFRCSLHIVYIWMIISCWRFCGCVCVCVGDAATCQHPDGAVHVSVVGYLNDCWLYTWCLAALCIYRHISGVLIVSILVLFRSRVSDIERSFIHPFLRCCWFLDEITSAVAPSLTCTQFNCCESVVEYVVIKCSCVIIAWPHQSVHTENDTEYYLTTIL